MEVALERIDFLENKIKDQHEEREEDSQRFIEIIGKSKEIFKQLFDKDTDGDSKPDTHNNPIDSTIESFISGI